MPKNLLEVWPKLTKYDRYWLIEWDSCQLSRYPKLTEQELMLTDFDRIDSTMDRVIDFCSHNPKEVSLIWAKQIKEKLHGKKETRRRKKVLATSLE